MSLALSLSNISKIYQKGKRALDDISFQLQYGQFVGLVGPNGAGKSTPGAVYKQCPHLLPGYVVKLDTDFAERIMRERSKGNEGVLPLMGATIDYWSADHPAF